MRTCIWPDFLCALHETTAVVHVDHSRCQWGTKVCACQEVNRTAQWLDALGGLLLLGEHIYKGPIRVHNLAIAVLCEVVAPDGHQNPFAMMQLVLPIYMQWKSHFAVHQLPNLAQLSITSQADRFCARVIVVVNRDGEHIAPTLECG